jgi:16S rRNA (guanine1207-N2)-methyltransferase
MSGTAAGTLFHPFENGTLALPDAVKRIVFMGARPGFRLPDGFAARPVCVQGFRPDYLDLREAGFAVTPEPEGEGYEHGLVLASRHRAENEMRLAEAIQRVQPGGLVVMAGSKEEGVGALRERLAKGSATEPAVPLGGHLSKYHGMVFWLARTPQADAFAAQAIEWHRRRPLAAGRFRTAPSSFSHDRIDTGSKLLADCLPASLDGAVADFCAGWGFLAVEAAARGARRVDLYEADYASLEAARDNMARLAPATPARSFWHDLVGEPVAERYDAIVMNPPFHQSRAAEPSLGAALIAAAAKATRKGGRLFLVANRQLPYEGPLANGFSRVEKLLEEAGFKVFCAVR